MSSWTREEFITLFPLYEKIRKLYRVSHHYLQVSIKTTGTYNDYTIFQPRVGKDRFLKILSSSSTGVQNLLRYLLLQRIKFLQYYEVDVYDMDTVYIGIGLDFPIMTNVKELLSKDYRAMIDRTVNYYTRYYAGSEVTVDMEAWEKSQKLTTFTHQLTRR